MNHERKRLLPEESQIPEFLTPGFYDNPYLFYSHIREKDPLYWSDQLNAWMVTGYNDIKNALVDKRFAASRKDTYFGLLPEEFQKELKPLNDFFHLWMLFADAPYHDKVKSLVVNSFTPRFVENFRTHIRERAEHLLSSNTQGSLDILPDFSTPLSVSVISEVLGISISDYLKIVDWTNKIIGFMGTGRPDVERGKLALQAYYDLKTYLYKVFEEKGENPTDDLISRMVQNQAVSGINDEELLATCANILIDGHEPSSLALANGIYSLLINPNEYEKLKANPQLLQSATEEVLRFEPPFSYAGRRSETVIEMHGQVIQPDQRVLFLFGGANRDPSVFESPDRFDISRSPNKHMTFSHGSHYCLGSALSRLTISEALGVFAQVVPNPTLIDQKPNWRQSIGYRAFDNLAIATNR